MNTGQKTGMRVALCDDEEVTHLIVEKYLEEWAREYVRNMSCITFFQVKRFWKQSHAGIYYFWIYGCQGLMG